MEASKVVPHPLWALLSDDERAHVFSWFINSASSFDLAKLAMVNHKWLLDARQERERRVPKWQFRPMQPYGGPPADVVYAGTPLLHPLLEDEDDFDDESKNDDRTADMRALALACKVGDLHKVCDLVGQSTPLDFFYSCDTPLKLAVDGGHAGCVRALLQAGARCLDTFAGDESIYESALWNGRLEVVMALTEFGVPRWGPSMSPFAHLDTCYGMPTAEIEARNSHLHVAKCSAERQQQIYEFLVATRKFNAHAGDPNVYIGLQVLDMTKLLREGTDEEKKTALDVLHFLWDERHEFGSRVAIRENAVHALFTFISGPLAANAFGLLNACWSWPPTGQEARRRKILQDALCVDGILIALLEVVANETCWSEDGWAMELLEMAAMEEESALSIFSAPRSIALLLQLVKDECLGWGGDSPDYPWRPCAAHILICLLERGSETRKAVLSASGADALRSFTEDPDVEDYEPARVAAARIEELLQAKIE